MDPTVFERIYESFCTSFFCQNSACAPRTQKLVIPASADRASAKCNMNQRIGTKDKTKNVGEMARAARFSREMAAARGLHGDPAQARRDSPDLGQRHDGRLNLTRNTTTLPHGLVPALLAAAPPRLSPPRQRTTRPKEQLAP